MEKERIQKAAQLTDDLRKVNRALGLFGDSQKVAVRISADLGEESRFAYLPQSILPAIHTVLVEAKAYITKEMEDL